MTLLTWEEKERRVGAAVSTPFASTFMIIAATFFLKSIKRRFRVVQVKRILSDLENTSALIAMCSHKTIFIVRSRNALGPVTFCSRPLNPRRAEEPIAES